MSRLKPRVIQPVVKTSNKEPNFLQIIFVFECEKGDNAASELKIAVLPDTEQEK